MDPHSFIARAEAQRWLGIAEKLLISHDLVGSKTFAIRARESDPRLEAAEQILAIADTLLAAEKRVVGNNGNHQPDYYAILQLVRFVQDTDQIASQYRRLAVLLNPHQNTFPYSDQAFQLVNDAWGVLSNPMRKSMYDSDLDYPPEQQMNSLGFNLEQQHHQQQQPHNFFSINHMATSHDQELPEQQQTFQSRLHQSHQHQNQHQHQHQQLQQHNFLSQPNPVRPLPVREQEHLFQHREQDQLFQSQVQPFQVTSPPHQTRPSPSPSPQPSHIQSPPATPQPPFSWAQTQQFQHQQMKQEQLQQEQLKQQQMQQKMQQDQLKQQQLQEEQRKLQQLQQEKLKQQQLMEEQRKQQQMMEEQRKQQQMMEEQRKQQKMIEEQRKQQQMMEEQRKQQQMMEEQRKQQQLMEEQRKQQKLMEEQRKQQQKLMEEQRKQQQLMEEQRKQQQLMEEQRKQQQLMEEQRKQQQLMEEQRKQQQFLEEQRKQQQLLEEQRKQQQLMEEQRKQQQILEEQRKQQQLMEEQRKQQFLEEQRKQQLLEEQRKQHQLEEEKRKQQLLEEQRKQQQLQEEQLKQQQLQEEQLKQQQMQQEQLKQQQLQESMKQNTTPVQPPGMFNTNNGVTEPEPEPEPETETEAETEPVDDSPTFWTACPYCFYMYEYPNLYIECTLRCDNCNRAFQAVPISSPPPIIEGQDACFYCWGFIPVGLSLTDLPKNNSKSTNSNWTPFSSLHDATNNAPNNVQNHLNEQAAPKQNPFVNKSSGPRIYIDDITDNVFLGVSDPSSDSDAEWDFTKNITKKQKSKTAKVNTGFKERIQVLALRALDTRTQNGKSTKNLKPGRVAKELGKLDLNVEFNTNEGEETGRRAINKARGLAREEDNIEGVGFFEGLDEYLSSLPILSGVKEEKVNAN